jgi:hypothetical protein
MHKHLVGGTVLLLLLLGAGQAWSQACTHYAAANGSGTACSSGTPCTIPQFVNNAVAGQVLCLTQGTYTGSNLLSLPGNRHGTSGNPITVCARNGTQCATEANDGGVLINGGNGSRPGLIAGNYWVIKGMNFTGGDNKSFSVNGNNNLVQRIVVYDGGDNNGNYGDVLIEISGPYTNNVIEDCAAFGKARKALSLAQGGFGANTLRRCWGRWEDNQHVAASPTSTGQLGYGADGVTFENVLLTWDTQGTLTDPEGVSMLFRTQNSQLLGSIAYAPATVTLDASVLFAAFDDAGFPPQQGDFHPATNVLMRHLAAVISPSNTNFSTTFGFTASDSYTGAVNSGIVDSVSIAGRAPAISGNWTATNLRHATSRAAMEAQLGQSIWTALDGLCHRVVNRVQTTAPLWPWPMGRRISEALVASGRPAIDVQAQLEASDMLGPLPATCLTGGEQPVATSLAFVQHPTTTQVSTTIAPPVTVEVRDQFGQRLTTSSASVTLALVSGTGLTGTLTQAATQGLATFSNLSITSVQTGLQLQATATGLTPATSNTFAITAGAPPGGTRVHWTIQDGTPATTLADTGDDGTWTGTFGAGAQAPTWTSGYTGTLKAIAFAQASQQEVTATSFPWAANEPVTVTMWVKQDAICATTGCGLFQVGPTNVQAQAFGAHLGLNNRLYWNYGNIGTGGTGVLWWEWPAGIETTWVRLGLVSSGPGGNEQSIYVNGQRVATKASASAPSVSLTGLTLGMHGPFSPSLWGSFTVQDVTIKNQMSTPAQMLLDYQGAPPPAGLTGSPSVMMFGRH